MTINEYLSEVRKMDDKFLSRNGRLYSEIMMNHVDIWSNSACIGYMLLAIDKVGLSDEVKQKLIYAMKDSFDFYSVDYAENRYR